MRVMTLAVPLLVAGCISTPPAKSAGEEIIYRMENTSVLEVFNLTRLWVASMGVNYLDRRDGRYGELGGSFEFCSDAEYFCLIGGIAAAIPKKFDGQTTWQFNGISCKSDTPLAEGLARERAGIAKLFETADAREGLGAFAEKRKPEFTGA